jgi:serine/threonine protein kinase
VLGDQTVCNVDFDHEEVYLLNARYYKTAANAGTMKRKRKARLNSLGLTDMQLNSVAYMDAHFQSTTSDKPLSEVDGKVRFVRANWNQEKNGGDKGAEFRKRHKIESEAGGSKLMIYTVQKTSMPAKSPDEVTQVLRSLQRLQHPNICRYYEGYEDPQHVYLVVDLVEGPPLLELLANHSKLTFQIIAKFCKDILEALNYAHHQRITHGDLAPKNLFLSSGDPEAASVVVTELHYAHVIKKSSLERLQDNHTLLYAAPEQVREFQATGTVHETMAADMWAFGSIVFKILTGHDYISHVEVNGEKVAFADLPLSDVDLVHKIITDDVDFDAE